MQHFADVFQYLHFTEVGDWKVKTLNMEDIVPKDPTKKARLELRLMRLNNGEKVAFFEKGLAVYSKDEKVHDVPIGTTLITWVVVPKIDATVLGFQHGYGTSTAHLVV